jgi:transcriptional regulator with XRE-family HTH domain
MTTSTGEDRDLHPAPARGTIPADTYAHRLMLARAHAGNLSIRAAAERCGLNHANWSNWEQGIRSRSVIDDVQAISEGLDVDREWLLFGGPLAKPEPIVRSRRRGPQRITGKLLTGRCARSRSAARRHSDTDRPRVLRRPADDTTAA